MPDLPLALEIAKTLNESDSLSPPDERSAICLWQGTKGGTLAQRIVEVLIGRLITDEDFRSEFLRDPEALLAGLPNRGLELSRSEIAALLNTDRTLWTHAADVVDPRLQKASLKTEPTNP